MISSLLTFPKLDCFCCIPCRVGTTEKKPNILVIDRYLITLWTVSQHNLVLRAPYVGPALVLPRSSQDWHNFLQRWNSSLVPYQWLLHFLFSKQYQNINGLERIYAWEALCILLRCIELHWWLDYPHCNLWVKPCTLQMDTHPPPL